MGFRREKRIWKKKIGRSEDKELRERKQKVKSKRIQRRDENQGWGEWKNQSE